MHATINPSRPDPSRSGAVWVTATGAFLLFAAAAVFTAVRWDQIPDAAKLAALVAATGGCLVAGRGLRDSLPASASALTHLGAFLVPVDVAALGIRADLDWPAMLLAQGVVATVTFGLVGQSLRSKVLGWAFVVSAIVLAGGVGATTALPAPLVLAGFAVAATIAGRGRVAVAWALVAGLAPALLGNPGPEAVDVLAQMGVVDLPFLLAIGVAVAAAVVTGLEGRRTSDPGLALIGMGVAVLGAVTSWGRLDLATGTDMIALAASFLAVEIVAYRLRRDEFWGRAAETVANVVEGLAAAGTVVMPAALAVIVTFGDTPAVDLGVAAAVVAAGWLAVEIRSEGRGRLVATIGSAVAAVSAVGFATLSPGWVAVGLIGVAAGAAFAPILGRPLADITPRPGAIPVALVAGWSAPLIAGAGSAVVTLMVGAAAALLLTETAVRRFRAAPAGDVRATNENEAWGWFLASSALVPALFAILGWAAGNDDPAALALVLVGAAAFGHLVAARAYVAGSAPLSLGTCARAGAVTVLVGAIGLPPVLIGLVALSVAALAALDAVRVDEPLLSLGTSLALPVAVAAFSRELGLSMADSGVATTLSAAVIWGVGSHLGRAWRIPVGLAVAASLGLGLALASTDSTAMADALIVAGGLGMAMSIPVGRLDGLLGGAVLATGGLWMRLADAGIEVSEPYVAPVGAILLVAGLRARSTGASSWVAYGPAVGLLGGSALVERIAGGSGWHAVAAGAVAVAAVVAGGNRRLMAPLFLGTALLVTLVGFETLAITRTLPTWTWLALGGATLLGAGVAMERRDMGPIETGRRLVDVISERYQ